MSREINQPHRRNQMTGSAVITRGYVVEELLRRGYAVVGIDDCSTPGPDPAGAI